jgi:hypothetical protein
MRRGLPDNEEAIAYALIMMLMFVLGAGLILAVLTVSVNGITDETNNLIDDGLIGVQTRHAIQFNIGAWYWWPVFVILFALFWYIVRPLEQKKLGG